MRITKEDIRERFEKYNDLYFGGILPRCKFHLHRTKRSPLGTYTYSFKNGKPIGEIWIAYNVEWSEETLCRVIVHEMIHHYVRVIEGKKGGIFGHNWRFKRQCKRIRKNYGVKINTCDYDIYFIGEKKPTNLFQKICRRLGF